MALEMDDFTSVTGQLGQAAPITPQHQAMSTTDNAIEQENMPSLKSSFLTPYLESSQEDSLEKALRPKYLKEYIGQHKVCEQLDIFITAARQRQEALDHVLLYGPPGLGKTTLAHIVAREMGVQIKQTSGPVLERAGDLAALLTNLNEGDILFIDEIHRLNAAVEEVLYPALEDYHIDIMVGEGASARSLKLELQPFTLIGATTRAGMLTHPLRDRFGITLRLEFYQIADLTLIVERSAKLLQMNITKAACLEVAQRARGTPRIANRLLRRVRDYAQVKSDAYVDVDIAIAAMNMLDVDPLGFDAMDRRLLETMLQRFHGGPVGLDNLAAALNEDRETIEEVIEPYLIQQGYIQRTARGRTVHKDMYTHFGIISPKEAKDTKNNNPGYGLDI